MAINYLLGFGERLMDEIGTPGSDMEKWHPYDLGKAKERLLPRVRMVSGLVSSLPDAACPNDEAVALIALHPAYLAKSYFPHAFLRDSRLRTVGSMSRRLIPDVPSPGNKSKGAELGLELFVTGGRSGLIELSALISQWGETSPAADDFRKIEDVRAWSAASKVMPTPEGKVGTLWQGQRALWGL